MLIIGICVGYVFGVFSAVCIACMLAAGQDHDWEDWK